MTLNDAIESLDLYVTHGIRPGGFLSAVIANDLMDAMNRADESSRENLYAIVCHVYNKLPSGCHGSYDRMQSWIEARQTAGAL